MGSAIPAVRDYLYERISALPECASPVFVSDGWSTANKPPEVTIGITPDDDGQPVAVVPAQLGGDMSEETFYIPIVVRTWKSGNRAAKLARDACFAIYDAIFALIRNDRALNNILQSGWALIEDFQTIETNTAEEAGEGRRCEIRFVVRCNNRY